MKKRLFDRPPARPSGPRSGSKGEGESERKSERGKTLLCRGDVDKGPAVRRSSSLACKSPTGQKRGLGLEPTLVGGPCNFIRKGS